MTKALARSIKSVPWLWVLVASLLYVPACYTILKHPTVLEEDYTRADTRSCTECHSEEELWSFHHPGRRYYGGYGYYDPWIYYYDIPWWYDSYWLYGEQGRETVPMHERGLRPGRSKESTTETRGRYLKPPSGTKSSPGKLKSQEQSEKEKRDDKKKDKRSLRKSRSKKKEKND